MQYAENLESSKLFWIVVSDISAYCHVQRVHRDLKAFTKHITHGIINAIFYKTNFPNL